tara:strand:+ start:798 stop:989 length:192 start_codon:yes stop_codon:yes gene_type:complete
MTPTEHPVFEWQWQSVREVERLKRDRRARRKKLALDAAVVAIFGGVCIAIGVLIGINIWTLIL